MNKLLFFFLFLFTLTSFSQTDSSLTYRKARIYNTYPCQSCPTDSLKIDPKKGISPYQFDKTKPIKIDSATYELMMLNKRRREEEQQPNLP